MAELLQAKFVDERDTKRTLCVEESPRADGLPPEIEFKISPRINVTLGVADVKSLRTFLDRFVEKHDQIADSRLAIND